MPRLEGSRALVIGGARRVGRAISVGLAEAGADVALTAYSSTGDGEATAQAIRALGRRSVALACNVRSTEEVDRAVRAAADELGGLDVLVYAAGAAFRGVAPEKVDLELFDEAIETILRGAFFAAQSSYEHLRERGGVIVFITDVAGIEAWPSFVPHSVAKAGLIHLTRVLAKAWAPSIRVCGVAPGTVLMEEGSSADSIANAAHAAALGRVGTPDDVVGAVNYLVEADYVTGVQLIVDGGRLL